jgi:glyoxylase-like metal-dependent hydrolase (beta-lactamase superfamily II)
LQDLLQNAAMDEIAPGIQHWKATHPNLGTDVSSYWLPDLGVLLDPLAVPEEVEDVELILLSCRHHLRDSLEAADRFDATVMAPKTGMHEFGEDTPIRPYDFGQSLAGGAITVQEVDAISPDESAFHIPSVNALSVADGAVRYGEDLQFVPDQLMDDPEETKAGLKRAFRRLADELDFDVLLLAHGDPIASGGREALRQFSY